MQQRLKNLLQISEPKYAESDREFSLQYRRVTREQLSYLKYFEKWVDLMVQLLSAIPTRKYLRLYLLSQSVLPMFKTTVMQHHSCILETLVDLLDHYVTYPIHDVSGEPLSVETQTMVQKDFLKELQAVVFKKFKYLLQVGDL